jgi:hypothetical protein
VVPLGGLVKCERHGCARDTELIDENGDRAGIVVERNMAITV